MCCGCKGHSGKNNSMYEENKKDAMSGDGSDPLKILNVRYARGELKREEYIKMREDITSGD